MPGIDIYDHGYFINDDVFDKVNENEWYYARNWYADDIIDKDHICCGSDLDFICFRISDRWDCSLGNDLLSFVNGKVIMRQMKIDEGEVRCIYDEDGKMYRKEVRRQGHSYFHNEVGPAIIWYKDGVVKGEHYYLEGVYCEKLKWEEKIKVKLYW